MKKRIDPFNLGILDDCITRIQKSYQRIETKN